MEKNNQDTLARAYAMLQGLRNNVAMLDEVEEVYAKEYHTMLDKLESVGIDVADFRIPTLEIKPRVNSQQFYSSPRITYSNEKYVPKPLLLAKLDAILKYFEITTSEKPRKIGFSPPDK